MGAPVDSAEPPQECVELEQQLFGLEAGLTGVATVARVRWSSDTPMQTSLVVTGWRDQTRETPLEATPATAHEHLLTGLHQQSSYTIQARGTSPDGTVCSAEITLETGSLPASLAPLSADVRAAADDQGYTFTHIISENSLYAAIIDNDGEYVWAAKVWDREVDGGGDPGSHAIIFRVMPSPDGTGIIFNTQGERLDETGDLVHIAWTGEELSRRSFLAGHTDFVLLPDGGAAMLGWTLRSFGDRTLLGDTIMVQGPDGDTRVICDAFDHLVPDLGRTYNTGFMPEEGDIEDWSHVNSISHDAETNELYVTITANNGVARIDAETGETAWILSDESDDFDIAAERTVHFPHSVQRIGDELLVFNRRNPGDTTMCSGAVNIALDETARTAAETWRWEGGGCFHVGFLGNAQRTDEGNTVTSWSHFGVMDEVTPDKDLVWRVSLGIGAAFGFSHRAPTLAGAPQ